MQSFHDWLEIRESSPLTRRRSEAAKGLAPPIADYNSHSTPSPSEEKSLKSKLKKSKPKKKS